KTSVSDRFNRFLCNLALTPKQREDGQTKHRAVRKCLNLHYWGSSSEMANSMLIGSWGKNTEKRPPRDIDVLHVLPDSVRERLGNLAWGTNKQSYLLREVKGILAASYTTTEIRADGQVVVVPFASYIVEVAPAFEEKGLFGTHTGKYVICDTNDGGRWKTVDPVAEQEHVKSSNDATKGDTRNLIRMMKRWQDHCNVPIKSFVIELLAIDFLRGWEHAGKGTFWYDYMVHDFLSYMKGRAFWGSVTVPGTGEEISWFQAEWKSRAETAQASAVKACEFEASDKPSSDVDAGLEWQKVFGDDIPLY
ncbi:MAG TPA: hypothetical protein VMS76_18445, partial [Planctomycetota bacterium]|nr:hypothetical protein [Planctomycetota bacterium]